MQKTWKGGHANAPVSASHIIRQVQENKALIIFDGLDEVIVHMEPKIAQDFIRQLWGILPPLKQQDNPNAGKMLISCRSHYFRDIQQQNTMLTGEHRENIKGKDYQALILLPFTQEQIQSYLQKSLKLDGTKLQQVIDLIESVHNLPEIAERPYTLSLIAEYIPQIEQLALQGETIQGVTLYKSMVKNWLMRDNGKHQFSEQHKQQLMEYLAAALWKSGQRQWTIDELDTWLDDFLYENPRLAAAYQLKEREVLKEDLRTATFIVRPDDEHFRFAHTSLQEYFLASYLHRALVTNQREQWELNKPSEETLDFLVQLILSETQYEKKYQQHLSEWLKHYHAENSLIIFYVFLLLAKQNYRLNYEAINLEQADLFEWKLSGTKEQPLVLHHINFNAARLDKLQASYITFQHASFDQASLWQAEFQYCQFTSCTMQQANLTASTWRKNQLQGLKQNHCDYPFSRWIFNHAADIKTRDKLGQNVPKGSPLANLLLNKHTGHSSWVTSVAYSPDGKQVASGSDDQRVKLWNASTGECLQTLKGHSGAIFSVAYSPDGKQVASGSPDQRVKLWDTETGECLTTLYPSLTA